MKQNRWIIGLVFAGLLANSFSPSLRADEETDRVELRKIKAAYEEAINTNDPKKIAPFLAENVTGAMVTGEQVNGFQGLEAYWKKIQDLIGPGGTYRVKVNVDKTEFHGDVSVSRGTTEDEVHTAGGKDFKFTSLWTAVCHKEKGAWKVLRLQATMDPVNNVFVTMQLQTTKILYGVAGLLGGVILSTVTLFRRCISRQR